MGVPALFRWLTKKYPRLVTAVEEEEQRKVPKEGGQDGEEEALPIDISKPNPNGEEFDCLYLDMNGIVHPCTHPEGKPAPETEEEMMLEIFAYTERIINMIRPRKLLMIAIDGVAPRAKMNQQRSRRFRAAQEAKEKEEEKQKALDEWKAMGLPVTDEAINEKKAWDSNAITPGTPFMDLLAGSLRYWAAKKLNEEPSWKDMQIIISDASVPGEGEHKIMDFIRRQRAQPEHDPNTRHVIYGLDADLIMLSLATHEPYFKVLREDVFAQEQKIRKCHRCGRQGHIAANCIGEAKEKSGQHDDAPEKPPEKKPFIFLDVVVLREYLEIELNLPGLPFKFDLERAIDDWVFLIFFVGNDFLPHLPSLEIREGAIDILLKIWKKELPQMGGYLTKHGKVEMKNVQLIMDGIAQEEDEIFRRRKEAEDRQDANTKRRKLEDESRQRREMAEEKGFKYGEQEYTEIDQAASRDGSDTKEDYRAQAIAAYESGKTEDIIANQKAIRLANLSAAEQLKAELKGKAVQEKGDSAGDGIVKAEQKTEDAVVTETDENNGDHSAIDTNPAGADKSNEIHAGENIANGSGTVEEANPESDDKEVPNADPKQLKRKRDADGDSESSDEVADIGADTQDADDPVNATNKERTINADGSVEYEDTVKLWEPGYRERYYQQKFGVSLDDKEFRYKMVQHYMEGMCWVLAYYYHGCPSWTWYYPYHFSPFAADFTDLETMQIDFVEGKPFRPYDQLMGVLPAASRASIPPVFHPLMIEEDSEIIDFYPETFSIDMNGKKMAWQGVALLPFIDEKRLLEAISKKYDELSEDEVRRNSFGDNVLLVAEEHALYDEVCALYEMRKPDAAEKTAVNPLKSRGISGFIRPDPTCVPGSTFVSLLTNVGLVDLLNDRSISALYDYPPQSSPHRSVLLKGVKLPAKVLTAEDREMTRRGGRGQRGRGGGGGGRGGRHSGGSYGHHSMHMDNQNAQMQQRGQHMRLGNGPMHNGGPRAYGGGAYGQSNGGAYGGYPQRQPAPPPQQQPSPQPMYGAGNANGAGYGYSAYGAPNAGATSGGAYGAYGGYGGYAQQPYAYQGPPPAQNGYSGGGQYDQSAAHVPSQPYMYGGGGYGAGPYQNAGPPPAQPNSGSYGSYSNGTYGQQAYGSAAYGAYPNGGGYGQAVAPTPQQQHQGPPRPLMNGGGSGPRPYAGPQPYGNSASQPPRPLMGGHRGGSRGGGGRGYGGRY